MLINESTVGLIMVVAIVLLTIIIGSSIKGNKTEKVVWGILITAFILALLLLLVTSVLPSLELP